MRIPRRARVPIKNIRPNVHRVFSQDELTGKTKFQEVTNQYFNHYPETVYINMVDNHGNKQRIVSNRIHPFFALRIESQPKLALVFNSENLTYKGSISGGAWIEAANLESGDQLLQDNGKMATVTSVEIENKPLKAYNLTVANTETFYVRGINSDSPAIWVHNCAILSNTARLLRLRHNPELGAKTVAIVKDANGKHGVFASGYDMVKIPGKSAGVIRPYSYQNIMAWAKKEANHEFPANGFTDKGVTGRANATHGEVQALRHNPDATKIGLSTSAPTKAMCSSCVNFFTKYVAARAKKTGAPKELTVTTDKYIYKYDASGVKPTRDNGRLIDRTDNVKP